MKGHKGSITQLVSYYDPESKEHNLFSCSDAGEVFRWNKFAAINLKFELNKSIHFMDIDLGKIYVGANGSIHVLNADDLVTIATSKL